MALLASRIALHGYRGAFAYEGGFQPLARGPLQGRAGAMELLQLQDDVGEKQGEGDASPHDRFVEGTTANVLQSGDAKERSLLAKILLSEGAGHGWRRYAES